MTKSFSTPEKFCFVCKFINGISMYLKCLNFLSFSDLHCVDIVSATYISMRIPHCLSHGRRHMLWRPGKCQNAVIDIEKTTIKMYSWDDIAWFII